MKKIKILNIFPKPDNITEISILSIYEIVLYIGFFLFFAWIYKSWTTIPEKTIELTSERIDPHFIKPRKWNDSITIDENNYKTVFNYHFFIPNSNVNIDSLNKCHIHLYPHSVLDLDKGVKSSKSNIRKYSYYLDSLFNTYNSQYCHKLQQIGYSYEIIDSVSNVKGNVYYSQVKSYQNTYRKHINYEDSAEIYLFDTFYSWKVDNNQKDTSGYYISQFEVYFTDRTDWEGTELYGIFDKPRLFDLFDISQCYYVIKSHSISIDTIKFDVHFFGANEYAFVKQKPDEIANQTFRYNITDADGDIILFVKSKELEVLQNSRLFFVTAILSGLIVIFLTFVVIFIYRLVSWGRMYRKNNKFLYGIINHSKNKHKRYKSRNNR